MKNRILPLFPFAVLLAGGCAQIRYEKVPTPTQYSSWDDEKQAKADAMEGVRYYLPRPFLHLKKSTPVAQRVALVSFVWSDTEKAYLLQSPVETPAWVLRSAPRQVSAAQALAVVKSTAGELQAGELEPKTEAPASAPPASEPPSTAEARVGYINATDPITRLDDRMDVVYLPDMEEQYVIRASAGLGRVDVEARLRNGWAAEVFSKKVSNENLIPYVLEQVAKASEVAAGIVTTWAPTAIGVPPGTVQALTSGAGLESGDLDAGDTSAARAMLGNLLIFKLAEVRIAQPGVYPILKPRELHAWSGKAAITNVEPEKALDQFLGTVQAPWIRQDMAFIPCPPFTVIGFNTTTDIYLSSAMQPLSAGPEEKGNAAAPPETVAALNAAKGKVLAALKAAPAPAAPAPAIEWTASEVYLDIDGKSPGVKLSLKKTIAELDETKVVAALIAWIEKTLGKVEPQKAAWEADVGDASTTIAAFTLAKPLLDIAKDLK